MFSQIFHRKSFACSFTCVCVVWLAPGFDWSEMAETLKKRNSANKTPMAPHEKTKSDADDTCNERARETHSLFAPDAADQSPVKLTAVHTAPCTQTSCAMRTMRRKVTDESAPESGIGLGAGSSVPARTITSGTTSSILPVTVREMSSWLCACSKRLNSPSTGMIREHYPLPRLTRGQATTGRKHMPAGRAPRRPPASFTMAPDATGSNDVSGVGRHGSESVVQVLALNAANKTQVTSRPRKPPQFQKKALRPVPTRRPVLSKTAECPPARTRPRENLAISYPSPAARATHSLTLPHCMLVLREKAQFALPAWAHGATIKTYQRAGL